VRNSAVDIHAGSGRLLTCCDVMHVASQTRGPTVIENNRFCWGGDDPINGHSDGQYITGSDSPETITIRTYLPNMFAPGDMLEFVSGKGVIKGAAAIKDLSVEVTNKWPRIIYRIGLDRAVADINTNKGGDYVYDLSACGAPLFLRSNYFQYTCRTLPFTTDAVIEGNTYVSNQGALGIALHCEPPTTYPALEGPSPRNIVIRDNHFVGSFIALHANTPGDIRNIVLSNNSFTEFAEPALRFYGGKDITVSQTRIDVAPGVMRYKKPYSLIWFGSCENVEVCDLLVRDMDASLDAVIRLSGMSDTELRTIRITAETAGCPVVKR
ncbi:MAG: hypothetical protein AABZ39_13430, partial [Spirochaetota bacterium]